MSRRKQINRRNVALYIDLANMCESDMDWILGCVRRHGEIAIARAYANFAKSYFLESAAETLFLRDVRLIHCPGWHNGGDGLKDCADETMMADIQQTLVERRDIGRYIVCTGDAHFVPAVKRIRASGREAIVIAPADGPSRMLEEVAHKFLIAPSLTTDLVFKDASRPPESGVKPVPETQVPVSHSGVEGKNGGHQWRIPPNGPPPPSRPGPKPAQSR